MRNGRISARIERMHLIAGFGLFADACRGGHQISFLVGSNAVKSLLDTIPEFIKHGLRRRHRHHPGPRLRDARQVAD
ncbi:hypothetical protein LNQ03_13145 [Klebsiella pneumoniae subsp. pneumoniae]|nr:hypothetical protein [Klebsiella pneumoniae subsp. pneumoniae]